MELLPKDLQGEDDEADKKEWRGLMETSFDRSRWADYGFTQGFREEADHYLPFRQLFFQVAKSVVEHFIPQKRPLRILDLGCGDGLFMDSFRPGPSDEVVLIDGSTAMIEACKSRLKQSDCTNISYIHSSFQELLQSDPLPESLFDFIFSSLAIHHLSAAEKTSLFGYVYRHLQKNGIFINYDVVLAPNESLEEWYMSLWRQFIENNADVEIRDRIRGVPSQYKSNADNIPDTLEYQMKALEQTGFSNVDCYFKFGVFSLFGGTR